MSAEREEFEEIADRLRAAEMEIRHERAGGAVDAHVDMITAGALEGGEFATFQLAAKILHDALAGSEDWPALMARAKANADMLAVALARLAVERT